MTELKFSGPATLVGFPRDKDFAFEMNADRLTIKAGKEVFAVIEKEPSQAEVVDQGNLSAARVVEATSGMTPWTAAQAKAELDKQQEAEKAESEKAARKPRSPSIELPHNAVIRVKPELMNATNPYAKMRGAWFDCVKTANGRELGWFLNTPMVQKLEGKAATFLRFFIEDGTLSLDEQKLDGYAAQQEAVHGAKGLAGQSVVGGLVNGPIVPGQFPGNPQQTASQGFQPPQTTAGPTWAPPGGTVPSGGPSFM